MRKQRKRLALSKKKHEKRRQNVRRESEGVRQNANEKLRLRPNQKLKRRPRENDKQRLRQNENEHDLRLPNKRKQLV